MIYGKRWTKKFKGCKWCGNCDQEIREGGWRIYGCAEKGDRPYHIYFHQECWDPDTEMMNTEIASMRRYPE